MTRETPSFQTLVNVGAGHSEVSPIWLTLKDAQRYLSMGKNSFSKYIRPHAKEFRIGRAVFFERLDLDVVARETVQRYRCPNQSEGELIWDKRKCQASLNEETSGTLISVSAVDAFNAVLKQLT
jgi:hypothetical protein